MTIKQFFEKYPCFNHSKLSEMMGMHHANISERFTAHNANPTSENLKALELFIHSLGEELMTVKFNPS